MSIPIWTGYLCASPKSRHAGKAYEWSNYRLACHRANLLKSNFDDVLDPIGLRPHAFHINFASGAIFPNPALPDNEKSAAKKTIARLKLDASLIQKMRREDYDHYWNGRCTLDYLRRRSPFVYAEIVRQGLQLAGD